MNSFNFVFVVGLYAVVTLATQQDALGDPYFQQPIGSGPWGTSEAERAPSGTGYILFQGSDSGLGGLAQQNFTQPPVFYKPFLSYNFAGSGTPILYIDDNYVVASGVGNQSGSFDISSYFENSRSGTKHTIYIYNLSNTGRATLVYVQITYQDVAPKCRFIRGITGKTGPNNVNNPNNPNNPNGPHNFNGAFGPNNINNPSNPNGAYEQNGPSNPSYPKGPTGCVEPHGENNFNGPNELANPNGFNGFYGPNNAKGPVNRNAFDGPNGPNNVDNQYSKTNVNNPYAANKQNNKFGKTKKTGKTRKTGKNNHKP